MSQNERKKELQDKITSGFFGFWIRKYRLSFLITLAVIVLGIAAVIQIPKESSPSINLGMILVTVSYPGASPQDVDEMIVEKIYQSIEDIDGISKIETSASLGSAAVVLTLKTDADSKDVLNDVKTKVDATGLPSEADTPYVREIVTDTNRAFSFYVYSRDNSASYSELIEKSYAIKKNLESLSSVNSVDMSATVVSGGIASSRGKASSSATYDVEIIIPHDTLVNYGLSLSLIANSVGAYNLDMPIGNFTIGDKSYDFRIEGKNDTALEYLSTPIALSDGGTIELGDIAEVKRVYKNKTKNSLLVGTGGILYNTVGLTVNKKDAFSIFAVSNESKPALEQIFATPEFANYGYTFSYDLSAEIIDDYGELLHEAMITITVVFITMFLFIGFFDSLFATLTLPLAFLATFIILNMGGYSMNFLTNFSLILSFGIAIDTIIVIVQAASAKIRVGYEPRTALSLAIREYSTPLIAGVSTTIMVFIPMMTLPGIFGKFLAFIPVTIFGVLTCGLVFSLTINSALYILFVKPKKSYIEDIHATEYATADEKELLALEREGKTAIIPKESPIRTRIIHAIILSYKKVLTHFLESTLLRRLSIAIPVIFFFVGSIIFGSMVGFSLIPEDDNNMVSVSIEGPIGTTTEAMSALEGDLTNALSGYPEMKSITVSTLNNSTSIEIELTNKDIRASLGQRSVFDIDADILTRLSYLQERGLKVTSSVASMGPPSSGDLGINLETSDSANLEAITNVAKDLKIQMEKIPGIKDVSTTTEDTPGQFVFHIDKGRASMYGITPAYIATQISQSVNGVSVGTIQDMNEDMKILLKDSAFTGDVSSDMITDLPITIGATTYRIGDFIEVLPKNAVQSISRTDGNIQIGVNMNLLPGANSFDVSAKMISIAEAYQYPEGISYSFGGETSENSDLLIALVSAFFISVVVIFGILTLLFNSYSQPFIIMYSVITALPFVLIGLLLTDNPISLTVFIGFIAFTGISVNHGIILIYAIHENLERGMNGFDALVEAGSSRLEPMMLTTFTTAFGILPIALRDKFWSGMGFTIIFGIVAASIITLFVVKGIYYELYVRDRGPKKHKKKYLRIFPWNWFHRKKRTQAKRDQSEESGENFAKNPPKDSSENPTESSQKNPPSSSES